MTGVIFQGCLAGNMFHRNMSSEEVDILKSKLRSPFFDKVKMSRLYQIIYKQNRFYQLLRPRESLVLHQSTAVPYPLKFNETARNC